MIFRKRQKMWFILSNWFTKQFHILYIVSVNKCVILFFCNKFFFTSNKRIHKKNLYLFLKAHKRDLKLVKLLHRAIFTNLKLFIQEGAVLKM